MALNWGKGAEAVSEGLIRQADIGGLMYKQAASVESARKAGELKQQERLWDVGVQFAKQADSDYQTILEAIIEAESTDTPIPALLTERFEQAQTRRNEAYAQLGAISPGGGGTPEFTFEASIKSILDAAKISDVEDWRETFAEGKTPRTVDTMLTRIIEKGGLTGNAEARRQLEEQFLSALQQPTGEETRVAVTGSDIEGTGLITQADQGGAGPTRRLEGQEGSRRASVSIARDQEPIPVHQPLGPRGIGGTANQQAEELNNAAMQRAMSQMSQQGQQYWQKYMETAQREGRTNAISTLREAYNALSDADRQIVLQLQSALGI